MMSRFGDPIMHSMHDDIFDDDDDVDINGKEM